MSCQLQQSFGELASTNAALEQRVESRTAELQAANIELQRLSMTDGLTQIANRRHFDLYLTQEWKRLYREQQPLALILCDVDYFKKYNDHYGHQAGDRCLHLVASLIQQIAKRPYDLAARYGGEEFALILPATDLEGAVAVAAKIQQAVWQAEIPHVASEVSAFVTLSLGVVSLNPRTAFPETLIAAADQALYEAKRQGRNRYWCQPTSEGSSNEGSSDGSGSDGDSLTAGNSDGIGGGSSSEIAPKLPLR